MLGLRNQKNSKTQGNVGLALAILWFEQNGYRVYIPLTDSQEDDIAVKINRKLHSVQIRTSYHMRPSGRYRVNLKVSGGNRSGTGKVKYFDPEEVDFLFAILDSGEKYLIPSSSIRNRHAINLGGNPATDKYIHFKVE